ncbi:uncharacterized protein PG986_005061 [Apiospora aurea]|uniref:Uncharacterized protein n=1 Tax=Apiospora aurea TaxID=335848 RepID=A0ABR1QGG4_9PEZI
MKGLLNRLNRDDQGGGNGNGTEFPSLRLGPTTAKRSTGQCGRDMMEILDFRLDCVLSGAGSFRQNLLRRRLG